MCFVSCLASNVLVSLEVGGSGLEGQAGGHLCVRSVGVVVVLYKQENANTTYEAKQWKTMLCPKTKYTLQELSKCVSFEDHHKVLLRARPRRGTSLNSRWYHRLFWERPPERFWCVELGGAPLNTPKSIWRTFPQQSVVPPTVALSPPQLNTLLGGCV